QALRPARRASARLGSVSGVAPPLLLPRASRRTRARRGTANGRERAPEGRAAVHADLPTDPHGALAQRLPAPLAELTTWPIAPPVAAPRSTSTSSPGSCRPSRS